MDNRPMYRHDEANVLKRAIRRSAGWKPLARELDGEERERWYARGIEIYPGWVQYEKRAPRKIPVIELSRAGEAG
jgi:hypothetical protein